MKKLDQNGSHVIAVIVALVVLCVIAFAGFKVLQAGKPKTTNNIGYTQGASASNDQSKSTSAASTVNWMQTADGYQPTGTPPKCDSPVVKQFPADITKVTGVLYPGQFRGGNYKPHGGLRFDKSANDQVTVKAPFDGTIIDGSAYIADGAENDVQYTFDVMNDCGIMYRVGHLLTLSPDLAKIAQAFPAPIKNDSRTTPVNPGVEVKTGTVLATAVGTSSDKNVFFDWGIYDWRQANSISTNQGWLQNSQHNNALAKHAVCWFDQLSPSDKTTVLSLPAGDPASGKSSDYCK